MCIRDRCHRYLSVRLVRHSDQHCTIWDIRYQLPGAGVALFSWWKYNATRANWIRPSHTNQHRYHVRHCRRRGCHRADEMDHKSIEEFEINRNVVGDVISNEIPVLEPNKQAPMERWKIAQVPYCNRESREQLFGIFPWSSGLCCNRSNPGRCREGDAWGDWTPRPWTRRRRDAGPEISFISHLCSSSGMMYRGNNGRSLDNLMSLHDYRHSFPLDRPTVHKKSEKSHSRGENCRFHKTHKKDKTQ